MAYQKKKIITCDFFGGEDSVYVVQAAILEKAVDDYERALFYNYKSTINEVRSFFNSDWYSFLSGGCGKLIQKRAEKEVADMQALATKIQRHRVYTRLEVTTERRECFKENRLPYKIKDGFFVFGKLKTLRCAIAELKKNKLL